MKKQTVIERAYELAQSGPFETPHTIRTQLKREGYEAVDSHFGGRLLSHQLRLLIRARI